MYFVYISQLMILGNVIKKNRQGYIKYEEQSKKCIKYEVKVYKVYYIRNGTNYEQSRNRIYIYRNQKDQLCWQRIDRLPDDRVWRVIRKKWPINGLFGKMLVFEFCTRWWPKARTSRLTYGTQQRVHGRRHVDRNSPWNRLVLPQDQSTLLALFPWKMAQDRLTRSVFSLLS